MSNAAGTHISTRLNGRGEPDPKWLKDDSIPFGDRSLTQIIRSLKEARRITNECTDKLDMNARDREINQFRTDDVLWKHIHDDNHVMQLPESGELPF